MAKSKLPPLARGEMVTINNAMVARMVEGSRGEVMFAEPNRDNQWRVMVHQDDGGRCMFWIRRGYLTPDPLGTALA